MKDSLFFEGFKFHRYTLRKTYYTDNRAGVKKHYLAYMEQGRSRIVSEGRTIAIQPGDVFYIPKGLRYQSYWEGEDTIQFLSFGFHHFPETREKSYLLQVIDCPQARKEQVQQIPLSDKADSALLGSFFSALAALLPYMEIGRQDPRQALAEKARDYLYSHTDCKVSDVARHCLVSESVLYDVIKKEIGMTPNELRQRILCEKAEQLLATTDRSVQEISDRLGFSSASYFRKVLRSHTGKTPREIRKEAKHL